MGKGYIVIDEESTKKYKGILYISKRKLKDYPKYNIVGETKLKKYKSSSEDKKLDFLLCNDEKYEVKNNIYGIRKGYVNVGNNSFIELKRRIPFLLLFFILGLLLLLFMICNKDVKVPEEPPTHGEIIIEKEEVKPEEPPIQEEVIESEKEQIVPTKPKVKKYKIIFDSNGGYGNTKEITCEVSKNCILSKNNYKKDGHTFIGWSTKKDEFLYLDESTVKDLTKNKEITLYAVWETNTYEVSFVDFDDTIIQTFKLKYQEKIIPPVDPMRVGYKFDGWNIEFDKIKDNLIIKATYSIEKYEISYILNAGTIKDNPTNYDVEKNDIIIPNPEKTGYTFIGWNDSENSEFIKDYTIKKGTVGDIELTANYEANTYKLVFNSKNGDDSLISRDVKYDSEYGSLPVIEKDGYNFLGWKDDKGNYVSDNTVFKSTDNINLYAEWEVIDYDILYNLNGGTLKDAPTNYNVESSEIKISNPNKDGYEFLGWTTPKDTTPAKDYKIEKGSIGNIELTANYKPISYYIIYNSSDGTGTMEKSEYIYDTEGILTKNSFVKEGYTFIGWSTKKDGKVIYQDESKISNLSSLSNDEITLYAIWKINTYSVKYYDLFDVFLKEEQIDYGSKSTPPADPFIDGYTFKGWDSSDYTIKGDTIFKAQYSRNKYTIKYDLNIGTPEDKVEIEYNVESNFIKLPEPTRTGYTFLGWTGSNGRNPQVSVEIKKGSIGNKTYKANWKANEYNVAFNPNGGTVDISEYKITYNSVYGSLPIPKRIGYTFEGWYYNDNLVEEDTILKVDSNHELLAKWKVITYTIDYQLNNGSASSLVNKYNIETETFTLPTPTRIGYTFIGWTGSNGTTPEKIVSINQGSTGNKNYTANWEIITYNISYDLKGGNANVTNSYDIETKTFTLPSPTRTGYTFIGWTGSNGTTPEKTVSINQGSTGNKNYTANWKTITYSISYNLAGGSATSLVKEYNVETETITLPNPTRTGYTFLGWTGTGLSVATKGVKINKGSTESRSYTATWSKNYYTVSYYVNDSLWTQRSVGYNDTPENLNAQSLLDIYHTFHGWTGWVDKMPNYNINLYANITESYCSLTTGHGQYGNATALLRVFNDAGWTGNIIDAPSAPGYYMVKTDYNLTRAQAEVQKNYIASHTNYKNYNFPYLYWVAVDCTNGYGEAWTRSVGQSTFN